MQSGVTMAPARVARLHRGAARARTDRASALSPRPVLALRSAEDVAGIRRAGALVAEALATAECACVPGATTAAIDDAVRTTMQRAGGEPIFLGYLGTAASNIHANAPFPASSCVSVNEELVHGVPGARVIGEGDLVSIDAGVRLDGWCADSAVTVRVGASENRDELDALVDCAQAMLNHAIAAIRPGRRWSEIANGMEAIAADADFAIAVDFVGHGIGRELHESPQVPSCVSAGFLRGGDFTLRPGMVLAIEPMVVLERTRRDSNGERLNPRVKLASDGWTVLVESGARSCHVEHTVAVTRDGAEVLTVSNSTATTPINQRVVRAAHSARLAS